jgi:polyisoprenoid-binding protein YceI
MYKILTIIFLSASIGIFAQNNSKLNSDKVSVSFFSSAPIEDIAAKNGQGSAVINLQDSAIAVLLKINQFAFDKKLMQDHFNETYMESDKFPTAKYSGRIKQKIDLNAKSKFPLTTQGKLTIHGVTKNVTINGNGEIVNGKLVITSKFLVRLEDYDVKIPTLLIKNIAEEVEVTLELQFPLKK